MPFNSYFYIYGYLPSAEYLTKSISRQIVLILLLLCYHLWFQIDFACPCSTEQNLLHCYSYMLLPCVILTSIILWNDARIGRIFRYGCYHSSSKRRQCRGTFCFEFLLYVLQAATSGFLWCGSVLVDGDWYVCCGGEDAGQVRLLSCMEEGEMRLAEMNRKITLKNRSMIIGLVCISLTAACSLVLMLPWGKWFLKRNYFREMFEEAILEQTENILLTEMGKAAADAVKRSLLTLSSAANATAASDIKQTPEKEEKAEKKEEILLNINVDWDRVASLAHELLESIPKHKTGHGSVVTA